ncbi:hypothetical protein DXV76_16510 [Rhodobacteraceae bacterium CCMM004]|nr:hypothetical protein DXV76_16510 [Rhodobacteraceae bacterium CCMM004]
MTALDCSPPGPPPAPSVPDRLMELANQLAASQFAAFRELYAGAGVCPPLLSWAVDPEAARSPDILEFDRISEPMCDARGRILHDRFDLAAFGDLTGLLTVVRADADHMVFTYDHYGGDIAAVWGRTMQGRSTAEFQGPMADGVTALYMAAALRGERALSVNRPPGQVFVRDWRVYIVPMIDDDQTVVGFVSLNLPETPFARGLDLVPWPTVVCDAEGTVHLANRAAHAAWADPAHRGPLPPWGTLADALGAVWEPPVPADALAEGAQAIAIRLERRDGRPAVHATLSGVMHHERAFYVLICTPG